MAIKLDRMFTRSWFISVLRTSDPFYDYNRAPEEGGAMQRAIRMGKVFESRHKAGRDKKYQTK